MVRIPSADITEVMASMSVFCGREKQRRNERLSSRRPSTASSSSPITFTFISPFTKSCTSNTICRNPTYHLFSMALFDYGSTDSCVTYHYRRTVSPHTIIFYIPRSRLLVTVTLFPSSYIPCELSRLR